MELTPVATKKVAGLVKKYEICKADLEATNHAYVECSTSLAPPLAFYQTETFAIGAPVGAFILGMIVQGLLHKQ